VLLPPRDHEGKIAQCGWIVTRHSFLSVGCNSD